MQQGIQKLLVCEDKCIQFCRNGKHDMEIRGINDFGAAAVYPDLLLDSLAVRAISVPAGTGMDLRVAAVPADADVIAKFSGFAAHNGMSRFFLHVIRLEGAFVGFPAVTEDLLDL